MDYRLKEQLLILPQGPVADLNISTGFEPMCISSRESQMRSACRTKAKADAISRLNEFWVPVAPRIILIGSRIASEEAAHYTVLTSNLPTDHVLAPIKSGYNVFGTAAELPSPADLQKNVADYETSKCDLSFASNFKYYVVSS